MSAEATETHCYWCRKPLAPGERSCGLRELQFCWKRLSSSPEEEKTVTTDTNRSQQAAAAVASASTEAVVEERGRTHGRYEDMAATQVRLLEALATGKNWENLPAGVKVFLLATIQKMSRIVTGNPNEPDHYADIKGYAHLAHRTVTGEESVPDQGSQLKVDGALTAAPPSGGRTMEELRQRSLAEGTLRYGALMEDLVNLAHNVQDVINLPTHSSHKARRVESLVNDTYDRIAARCDASAQAAGASEDGILLEKVRDMGMNLDRAREISEFLIKRSEGRG